MLKVYQVGYYVTPVSVRLHVSRDYQRQWNKNLWKYVVPSEGICHGKPPMDAAFTLNFEKSNPFTEDCVSVAGCSVAVPK